MPDIDVCLLKKFRDFYGTILFKIEKELKFIFKKEKAYEFLSQIKNEENLFDKISKKKLEEKFCEQKFIFLKLNEKFENFVKKIKEVEKDLDINGNY